MATQAWPSHPSQRQLSGNEALAGKPPVAPGIPQPLYDAAPKKSHAALTWREGPRVIRVSKHPAFAGEMAGVSLMGFITAAPEAPLNSI
jgi:hypothetical protein